MDDITKRIGTKTSFTEQILWKNVRCFISRSSKVLTPQLASAATKLSRSNQSCLPVNISYMDT